ncbi:hypothetical protein [Agrobacterium pusense]|uniref:hypothetical protein n=1 Tax=Agrobacterium pusense TaxID=648995 RepID=UPI000D37C7C1|nr:hypothetical protein [Agrobacterium pusense]PTV70236.1 hypothetical protein DBL06_25570 [Agrobacterium pusense]
MTTAAIFTNPDKIEYQGVWQHPTDRTRGCYDLEFYETDLARAFLTYDFGAGEWFAMIAQTETVEDDFRDDVIGTPEQIAALLVALPADHRRAAENWETDADNIREAAGGIPE